MPNKIAILVDDVWRLATFISTNADGSSIEAELNGKIISVSKNCWTKLNGVYFPENFERIIIGRNIDFIIEKSLRKQLLELEKSERKAEEEKQPDQNDDGDWFDDIYDTDTGCDCPACRVSR